MKKLTTLMAAAAAAVTLSGPLMAQETRPAPIMDFGTVTGTFNSLGFNNDGEAGLRSLATGSYEGLAECLQAASDHHAFFAGHDLFTSFDVATRIVCAAENVGVTFTAYYGSPLATNRLKQQLPN